MNDDSKYEYDIFISYNRADEAWARQLATRLEHELWRDRKLRVFFAPWDIKPGESIPERLEYAIPRSRKVGLILSPESVQSEWVKVERYVTHYIDINERLKRLIPLYRRACVIPPFLSYINYLDFQDDAKFEDSYRILLATIKDEPLPRGEQTPSSSAAPLPRAIPRPPTTGFVPRLDAERRRDLVERLKEELAPDRNQVVALWGTGGVGKTTLAAETARELEATFAGRIVWTSALDRADFIFTTLLDEIATQLGKAEMRTLAPEERANAVSALASAQPTLVILDNFETIRPDEQVRSIDWLKGVATCPALITTRVKIDRVRNIQVAGMSPEEARTFLDLLIEDAQDKDVFTESVREEIIRTAEATPYVIQWVFAQIDLADDPQDVFADLARGVGNAATRVFDRSFNLPQLGDDGRAALLALTLFVPDASRDALAEVAGFGDDTDRAREAIRRLSALRLILTKEGEQGRRLAVTGLTLTFARARLEKEPQAADFRQRFVSHFLKYAEAHSKTRPEHFDALGAEKDNLLNALDVAQLLNDRLSMMRIPAEMYMFLYLRGYWDEAIQRGEQALEAARSAQRDEWVSYFTHNIGLIYQFRGDLEKARQLYDESLEIKRTVNDQRGIASTLHQLGWLAQEQGNQEEALRLYDESLEIKKKLGHQVGIAVTLHQLGWLAQDQGDYEKARRLYDESLEISREQDDQSGIAITMHALAVLLNVQGDLKEARRLYEESLDLTKKLGDKSNLALIYYNLGLLTKKEGNRAEAVRLLNESLRMFEELRSSEAERVRRELASIKEETI